MPPWRPQDRSVRNWQRLTQGGNAPICLTCHCPRGKWIMRMVLNRKTILPVCASRLLSQPKIIDYQDAAAQPIRKVREVDLWPVRTIPIGAQSDGRSPKACHHALTKITGNLQMPPSMNAIPVIQQTEESGPSGGVVIRGGAPGSFQAPASWQHRPVELGSVLPFPRRFHGGCGQFLRNLFERSLRSRFAVLFAFALHALLPQYRHLDYINVLSVLVLRLSE